MLCGKTRKMVRSLPWDITPGQVYDVTMKTFQARYFFIPSHRLNDIVTGVFAYAKVKLPRYRERSPAELPGTLCWRMLARFLTEP